MTVGGINNIYGANSVVGSNNSRVLGEKFNYSLEDINSGSKVNKPLYSFSNPETGESVDVFRSDVYSDDNPLYIIKGVTAKGEEFEKPLHAWIIDPRNCNYAELMVLNLETGNTSPADKARVDALFDNVTEKRKEDGDVEAVNFLDKADYSTAMKDVLDEYMKSGNYDSYLSMDKWQQSINDYTSVPVYFTRDIVKQVTTERNGISTVSCSFATVRSLEDIQKEWNDKIIEAAKNNKTSMRDVLKKNYPNAEKMKWGIVGSDKEMTFDEFVEYLEEENKKWIYSNKEHLEKMGIWDYVK